MEKNLKIYLISVFFTIAFVSVSEALDTKHTVENKERKGATAEVIARSMCLGPETKERKQTREQTQYKETDLHKAAKNGDFNLVKGLTASGANVNAQDEIGNTALMAIANKTDNKSLEIAKYLIEHTNLDIKNALRQTAWDIANDIKNKKLADAIYNEIQIRKKII